MSRLKQLAFVGLSVSFAATIAQAGVANSGSLSVGTAVAMPGDTGVQVVISADTVTNEFIAGLTVLTFSVNFDTALCPHLTNLTVARAGRIPLSATPEISGNSCPGTGSVMFNLSDPGGAVSVPDGSGPIITWTFDVGGGSPTGVFPLTVSGLTAASGPADVSMSTAAGQLTITGDPTNTPTISPTSTPTATPSSTPTSTNPPVPSDTPTEGPSPTPTNTPSITPTSTPTNTPTETNTPTQTSTPTNTPTITSTHTPTSTPTSTNTPTNTPVPTPRIVTGASAGSTSVAGTAAPNSTVEIRTVPGGEVLGTTMAGPGGSYSLTLNRALVAGETIRAFDTTNDLPGADVQVGGPPAPIPAVGWSGAAALVIFLSMGLVWRLRRE